jgi:hypothetical protein
MSRRFSRFYEGGGRRAKGGELRAASKKANNERPTSNGKGEAEW